MNEFTRRIEPFAAGATALAGRGLKLNVRPHGQIESPLPRRSFCGKCSPQSAGNCSRRSAEPVRSLCARRRAGLAVMST